MVIYLTDDIIGITYLGDDFPVTRGAAGKSIKSAAHVLAGCWLIQLGPQIELVPNMICNHCYDIDRITSENNQRHS